MGLEVAGFWVQGLRFIGIRIKGLGFRVRGLGLRVEAVDLGCVVVGSAV